MKTNILKYFFIVGLFLFLIACSTKKNTFISRNSHALSARDNILFNGGIALDKGITDLKTQYKDNFWEVLPIERMQIAKEAVVPGQKATPNPNFDKAETKATKAIQKHSMYIAGSEKNPQMDEAHLLLGKSRYYDQRFVPALEAFNYILYKYPKSNKINEAKVWREKTNIRLDNDAIAVENLSKLLSEIKFRDQIFADANAILAQAFLNLGEKDSAIVKLKLAKKFTKQKEEKARYHYILGQLYEGMGLKDSAFASYQSIIEMKRKAARQYVIHAHLRQANQFDAEKGDTIAFLKKYDKLIKDRENRPFLDVLNHQLGLYYDGLKNFDNATKFYNKSLKTHSTDTYLVASNFRNLADIYFKKAKYVTAGKYYDSTLVQLKPRTREYNFIKKKRENLEDVIKYEGIAIRNDSILQVSSLADGEKISYYEAYITKLKVVDEKAKKELELKQANGKDEANGKGNDVGSKENTPDQVASQSKSAPPTTSGNSQVSAGESKFYFYNPSTVAYGKAEFRKNWGNRVAKGNWRISEGNTNANTTTETEDVAEKSTGEEKNDKEKKIEEKYTPDFYIKKLPKSQTVLDSIFKERNFAYYQLGVIYKEKFKEYKLAAAKLERLLDNKPEERLVLPSMYNLYKIYEIIDKDKALAMKNRIISQYPDSRYAQILNTSSTSIASIETPETSYDKLYKEYESRDYKTVLTDLNDAIDQYAGEEIVPKFELLKANTVGKIMGLAEFRKSLNFVALNYPNSEEGKRAEELLSTDIPVLEGLKFYERKPLSWKILYKSDNPDDKKSKALQETIEKFIKDRSLDKLTLSYDMYTMDKNFIVIHGLKSEEYAKGIVSILKEFKEYKIQDTAFIISNENYKIVQIKKNFEEYLVTKPSDPLPPKPYVPKPKQITKQQQAEKKEEAIKSNEDKDPGPPGMNQLPPQMPKDGGNMPDQKNGVPTEKK